MDTIKEVVAYISGNWYGIIIAGSMLLALAEMVTRLTPTTKDDGFVQRLANGYNKLFELLKVPNIKKKDGTLMVPMGMHPPKEKAQVEPKE